jgi:L-ribulose-5-phosphate 3-epimerase
VDLTRRSFLEASLLGLETSRLGVPVLSSFGQTARQRGALLRSRLGIITDEISDELGQAVDFISNYKLTYCELRAFWRHNIVDAPQADLDRARQLLERHGLKVSDIASPVLKWNLPEMPARPRNRDTFGANFSDADAEKLLLRSFKLARFFGTNKVRIFSFWRVPEPEKAYPYVRDRLAKVAEVAGNNGVLLVLENEHECNVGTGRELGRILRDINSPHLRGNWDPGNAAMLGETPYPDGYREVKGLFAHMHIKDVKRTPDGQGGRNSQPAQTPQGERLAWAPVGGGFIDWKEQLKTVSDDGYEGTLSLETHYRRPDHNALESTRESLQGLLQILDQI